MKGGDITQDSRYQANRRLFASAIKKILNEKGISKGEFANTIGVSQATISRYLAESTLPDADVLIRIAELYGISIDYMLMGLIRNPELLPEYLDTTGILLRDDIIRYVQRPYADGYLTLNSDGEATITREKAYEYSNQIEEIADTVCMHEIIEDLKELRNRYQKMLERVFSAEGGEK